jgi:hypothetical protein
LNINIKNNFDKIQNDKIWNNICFYQNNCIIKKITEMNELYYSNPKPDFNRYNLYGAAGNLIPHRDCILFNFKNINLYRIIISLSEFNNDTITEFINLNLEHKLNLGDYMIFDFDKTLHQVKKIGKIETPRILMKLHYIVCDNCSFSNNYIDFISYFYINYYYIARYTEQIGTDPSSFMGFFYGLLWEYLFYIKLKYILTGIFFIISLI